MAVVAEQPLHRWLWLAIGLIALLLFGQNVNARDSRRSSVAVGWSEVGDLDADAKYLTEDYLELLEQLRHITLEYQEYFTELDVKQANDYVRLLSDFYQVINDTNEYRDHNNLYQRLQLLQQHLEEKQEAAADSDVNASEYSERITDLREYQASLKEQLADVRSEIREIRKRSHSEDEDSRVVDDRIDDLEQEVDEIRRDLTKAAAKIKVLQNQQETAGPSPHLSRLSHSLQQELTVISDLLEDEVITRLDENDEYRDAIDQYVKLAIEAAKQASSMDLQKYIVFNKEALGRWKVELKGLEELNDVYMLLADSLGSFTVPEAPAVPAWTIPSDVDEPEVVVLTPMPPVLPTVPGTNFYLLESDKRAVKRRLVDSIDVPSTDIPIYVVMPSANLKVAGWSENRVVAECEYVVRADSKTKSEKISSNIDLRLFEKGKAVYVESVMPTIGDASDIELAGTVTIMIPKTNPVVLNNSFGMVSVADLHRGVKLSSRNSTVNLQDLSGDIDITSTMGSVFLTGISGNLDISNGYGTMLITDCQADMKISNEYAAMNIKGCGGKALVETSGHTTVTGFVGDVNITGNACPINISDIKGVVEARTSFQPLDIKDVSGTITADNVYSSINLVDIEGRLTASVSHGDLLVDEAPGPMDLRGDHGEISFRIPRNYAGNSNIAMDRGSVHLLVYRSADLYVVANTAGGELKTDLEVEKSDNDPDDGYKVKIGRGTHKLNITGENVDVAIDRK
ncbi:MAG TPA: hypothetical protein PLF13_02685 [candidate division Zixibacteria bacterium]|nr:hypothetical protein [candidate division Zixibacteria bacterium]